MTGKLCSSSKSLKTELLGNDVLEQRAQSRNVPLPVTQLVDELVLGLFRRDVKGLIKGAVRRVDAQAAVENEERLAHGVDDVLGVRFDLLEQLLRPSSLRDVFHRQEDELGMQSSGVEQHHPAADVGKIVFEDEIVEDGASGHDVFEQRAQSRNVPLAIAQLVNETTFGFRLRNAEGLIEGGVCRSHAQSGIEDEQRFTHGIKNVLREILNVGNERNGLTGETHRFAQSRLDLRIWNDERFGHGSPPGCFNRSRSQGAGSRSIRRGKTEN